jgi:hypothetical protein
MAEIQVLPGDLPDGRRRQTLPFGPHFRAIPLSVLWEATPAESHH